MDKEGEKCISRHDKAVLNRLFNPELPNSDVPDDEQNDPVDSEYFEIKSKLKCMLCQFQFNYNNKNSVKITWKIKWSFTE